MSNNGSNMGTELVKEFRREQEDAKMETNASIEDVEDGIQLCSSSEVIDKVYLEDLKLVTLLKKIQIGRTESKSVVDEVFSCDEKEFRIVAIALYSLVANNTRTKKKRAELINNREFVIEQSEVLKSRIPKFRSELLIESTADVMRCFRIPTKLFFVTFCIQFIQALSYFAILVTSNAESVILTSDKVLAVLFASISFTMTAFDNITPVLVVMTTKSLFKTLTVKTSCSNSIFTSRFADYIMSMEFVNLVLLVYASFRIVPIQPDPLSIILNCTALFCVSQLDDQVFRIWKLKIHDKYYIDEEEQSEYVIKAWKIRELSVLCSFLLMILLLTQYKRR